MVSEFRMAKIYINGRFLSQPLTGVQRYAREVCQNLDALISKKVDLPTNSVELIVPRCVPEDALHLRHIKFRRCGWLTGHAWEQLELPFYSRDGLLFCPANTAPMLSLWLRRKTVVTLHCLSHRMYPDAYTFAFRAFYNFIVPAVLRYGSAVVTVSNSERETILSHYRFQNIAERLHAVANGNVQFQDLTDFSEKDLPQLPNDYVLFVGSLTRRKNLQGLINAMALLPAEHSMPLVIVGVGGKVFQNADLNLPDVLADRVLFIGKVSDQILGEIYRRATCFVFPSFYEGFGLPALEAMSCGCPTIVSNAPVMREVCGDAALYCNPHDPADIAAKIATMCSDQKLRNELKSLGYSRSAGFTWKRCAEETYSIMQKVLAA